MESDLSSLFESIPPPPPSAAGVLSLSAVKLAPTSSYRIARSSEGFAYFLVETAETPSAIGVRLENLIIEPNSICTVYTPGGIAEQLRLTLVGCTSLDPELRAYFLRLVATTLERLPLTPQPDEIVRAIATITLLFQSMHQPPRKSAMGLWGELFVIHESQVPKVLLEAWHSRPRELFDFSDGETHLEVKSAAEGRQHAFRIEQLIETPASRIVIASLNVRLTGNGLTVGDLVSKLGAREGIGPDERLKLKRVVAETLGQDWRLGMTLRFDEGVARRSLQFFRAKDVPSIGGPLFEWVSDIHFTSDLTAAEPISEGERRTMGSLLGATTSGSRTS